MGDQLTRVRRQTKTRANIHVVLLGYGDASETGNSNATSLGTRVAPEATTRWGCKYARQDSCANCCGNVRFRDPLSPTPLVT